MAVFIAAVFRRTLWRMESSLGEIPRNPRHILIAEDHPLYREALRTVINRSWAHAELSEACTQSEVLTHADSDDAFDLVILDLNIPGAAGLSCLIKLRAAAPLTPILVVSGLDDPGMISEVVIAGATGYVSKSASREVLIDAIRAIMNGGTYLPAAALAAMRSRKLNVSERKRDAGNELTAQQHRVLRLLAEGLSNKQIARELKISEITVKVHVSSILKKLGVANRVKAAMEARKLLSSFDPN